MHPLNLIQTKDQLEKTLYHLSHHLERFNYIKDVGILHEKIKQTADVMLENSDHPMWTILSYYPVREILNQIKYAPYQ